MFLNVASIVIEIQAYPTEIFSANITKYKKIIKGEQCTKIYLIRKNKKLKRDRSAVRD